MAVTLTPREVLVSVKVDPDPSPDGTPPAARRPEPRGRGPAYVVAGVLLLAPFVALLWVSSYAKDEPRLFGFPFFYWYQLMWVFIAAAATYVSYLLVRRVERPHGALTDRSEPRGQVRP